ncbi:MAG TPA: tetratricopeptide repeat protein [Verrucomicrobiae bacterium]
MSHSTSDAPDKIVRARALADKAAWTKLLEFAKDWREQEPSSARAYFFQGVALAGTGRFVEAETSYRQALELDANDFKTWNNLSGVLFDALKKPMDALRCMEQALKLEPRNKLGWSNLASMLGRMGRHEKAMEFAGHALELDPHFVEALLHKATAAKALGRPEIVKEVSLTLASIEANKFKRGV